MKKGRPTICCQRPCLHFVYTRITYYYVPTSNKRVPVKNIISMHR